MRSKSILLLTLALGCGLVASIGISQVMDRTKANAPTPGETEPIFVALVDIESYKPITPQVVKLEEWPKDKIPAGAIKKLEEVENKRSRAKLFAGEPILAGKLMGLGENETPANKIKEGYRVVSVRVDAVTGASSLILPGDRVDVLVYFRKDPANGITETITKTILKDVQVFAVDTVTDIDRKPGADNQAISAKTVSLLVTPEQAERITTATESGTIRLVMRSPGDTVATTSDGISIGDLMDEAQQANRAKEDKTPEVKQTSGGAFQHWLDEQKQKLAGASEPVTEEGPAENWKIVLMQGSEMQEVELSAAGGLPTSVQGATNTANETGTTPVEGEQPPTETTSEGPTKTHQEGEKK